MSDGLADRYAATLTRYSRPILAVLLVLTLAMGASATGVDGGLSIASFGSDSTEAQKLDYVRETFDTGDRNTTSMQVVVRSDNVLSRDSLLETLRFQRAVRTDDAIGGTLAAGQPTVGVGNLVATAAVHAGSGDGAGPPTRPTLDEQIAQLEAMSASEVEATVAAVLDPERETPGVDPYSLLATDYEPGSTTASARVLFVRQATDGGESLSEAVVDAQLATRGLADEYVETSDAFVFGAGIVDDESTRATGESFALITPVALLLILGVLGVAYRDVVDVALALAGTLVTLVWMGGFMGWAGIGVTQILIAVPFLLVGLSIDYALHVVMRYREAREADPDAPVQEAMRVGLAGVTVAIAATTFTTVVGFLSNTVSPIQSIADFGLVSAVGIASAFVVFGALLPAAKLELDALLERFGVDRRKPAFGSSGTAERVVGAGTTLARTAPVVVVVLALVVSAGGGYAATDIDTSIDQVDFLPRDSPEWMDSLPGPFAPSDYDIREGAVFLNDNFAQSRDRTTVHVLVEGAVTDPETLDRVAAGDAAVPNASSAVTLANGRPALDSPVTAIRQTAAENETFAALVERNDPDGDGVPEANLAAVYDGLYETAPDRASAVVARSDGEYRALDTRITVSASATTAAITSEMRSVADTVRGDSALTVTATGPPVVDQVVQSALLRTLVETFLITLGVILAFLTALFYRRHGTPLLGAVTMVPVVAALGWILGAMYLLGIPFTTETAIIASIAIGLGVDYAIHVSERFLDELGAATDVFDALDATVTGTGGALLASAASTAAGFGVLVLALVPSLRRFGAVTSTAIAFAFVASVLVLPSLLALWHRHRGHAVTGG
ncbi:efflux RND transporter permease subunit [Halobacterium jilantaiense]|uniref:Predicted exporter protein, RND superfamily n=1 Tax=Halobacterium jilantaiense TaxID=355548 RepID=A0A1I0N3Z4_9EURY|nr:MMPL family transporter [Halobacterium jilantaiense]SEV95774.1 Predicted exporter protein, RND superfamily [Halobacterium jilantaiense]